MKTNPFFYKHIQSRGSERVRQKELGGSTGTMVTNVVALSGCQNDSPCHSVCQRSGGRCASNRCFPETENGTSIKHWKYLNKGLSGGSKVKEKVLLC